MVPLITVTVTGWFWTIGVPGLAGGVVVVLPPPPQAALATSRARSTIGASQRILRCRNCVARSTPASRNRIRPKARSSSCPENSLVVGSPGRLKGSIEDRWAGTSWLGAVVVMVILLELPTGTEVGLNEKLLSLGRPETGAVAKLMAVLNAFVPGQGT